VVEMTIEKLHYVTVGVQGLADYNVTKFYLSKHDSFVSIIVVRNPNPNLNIYPLPIHCHCETWQMQSEGILSF
jgi:hypothetical protein